MKTKTIIILISLMLFQVNGSKKKSRLWKWTRNGAAILTLNYAFNAGENFNDNELPACPYIVPQINALDMMKWITCAEQQTDFEKYLEKNTDKCPELQSLYGKAKSVGTCAFRFSESIVQGALSYFRVKPEKKLLTTEEDHREELEKLKNYLKNSIDISHGPWSGATSEIIQMASRDSEFEFFAVVNTEHMGIFLKHGQRKEKSIKKAMNAEIKKRRYFLEIEEQRYDKWMDMWGQIYETDEGESQKIGELIDTVPRPTFDFETWKQTKGTERFSSKQTKNESLEEYFVYIDHKTFKSSVQECLKTLMEHFPSGKFGIVVSGIAAKSSSWVTTLALADENRNYIHRVRLIMGYYSNSIEHYIAFDDMSFSGSQITDEYLRIQNYGGDRQVQNVGMIAREQNKAPVMIVPYISARTINRVNEQNISKKNNRSSNYNQIELVSLETLKGLNKPLYEAFPKKEIVLYKELIAEASAENEKRYPREKYHWNAIGKKYAFFDHKAADHWSLWEHSSIFGAENETIKPPYKAKSYKNQNHKL